MNDLKHFNKYLPEGTTMKDIIAVDGTEFNEVFIKGEDGNPIGIGFYCATTQTPHTFPAEVMYLYNFFTKEQKSVNYFHMIIDAIRRYKGKYLGIDIPKKSQEMWKFLHKKGKNDKHANLRWRYYTDFYKCDIYKNRHEYISMVYDPEEKLKFHYDGVQNVIYLDARVDKLDRIKKLTDELKKFTPSESKSEMNMGELEVKQ